MEEKASQRAVQKSILSFFLRNTFFPDPFTCQVLSVLRNTSMMKKTKALALKKNLTYPFLSSGMKHRLILGTLCLSLHHVVSRIHREAHPKQPDTRCNQHVDIFTNSQLYFHQLLPVQHTKRPTRQVGTCSR